MNRNKTHTPQFAASPAIFKEPLPSSFIFGKFMAMNLIERGRGWFFKSLQTGFTKHCSVSYVNGTTTNQTLHQNWPSRETYASGQTDNEFNFLKAKFLFLVRLKSRRELLLAQKFDYFLIIWCLLNTWFVKKNEHNLHSETCELYG